jgi:hypothetical protein
MSEGQRGPGQRWECPTRHAKWLQARAISLFRVILAGIVFQFTVQVTDAICFANVSVVAH